MWKRVRKGVLWFLEEFLWTFLIVQVFLKQSLTFSSFSAFMITLSRATMRAGARSIMEAVKIWSKYYVRHKAKHIQRMNPEKFLNGDIKKEVLINLGFVVLSFIIFYVVTVFELLGAKDIGLETAVTLAFAPALKSLSYIIKKRRKREMIIDKAETVAKDIRSSYTEESSMQTAETQAKEPEKTINLRPHDTETE